MTSYFFCSEVKGLVCWDLQWYNQESRSRSQEEPPTNPKVKWRSSHRFVVGRIGRALGQRLVALM